MVGLTQEDFNGSKFNLQHIPSDLLQFIDEHYETGEPDINSRNHEIDYDGSDFKEPEILPDVEKQIGCDGGENSDDTFGRVDYGDSEKEGSL